MKKHLSPIVAATLLLIPLLYAGSYFALVRTTPRFVPDPSGDGATDLGDGAGLTRGGFEHYIVYPSVCKIFFWPMEQLDRRFLRPSTWNPYKRDPFAWRVKGATSMFRMLPATLTALVKAKNYEPHKCEEGSDVPLVV